MAITVENALVTLCLATSAAAAAVEGQDPEAWARGVLGLNPWEGVGV